MPREVVVDLGLNHVLMPGLVNIHGHTPMTLLRGFADDLLLQSWLQDHIFPAEAEWVSEDFVRDGSRLAIAEMLRSGTTAFADMYYYGAQTAAEVSRVGMRALIGDTVLKFPTGFAKTKAEYIAKSLELHREYSDHPLVRICFAPHAPYTVDDDQFTTLVQLADKFDMRIMCHIQESAPEIADSERDYGMRPVARLDKLGVLSNRLLAVHCTQLNQKEIELFAKKGVSVAHCPESNMKLSSGACPVPALLAQGVNVGLGTDGAASNNDLDMFGELKTATFLSKLTSMNPRACNAREVLTMATLAGARALGMEKDIGTLETGKAADMIAVDLGRLASTPVYNPLSQLVYSAHGSAVSHVWTNGKEQLRNGTLVNFKESELVAMAEDWRVKIAESRERRLKAAYP
jgi:5-methylthioadenosine/S-adenosylhomocysteine deaminase